MENHKVPWGFLLMYTCAGIIGPGFSFSQSNDITSLPSSENTGTIPPVLLRPQRGEAPRYPRDAVIGELGMGQAPEDAYVFARSLMTALLYENRNSRHLSPLGSDFWNGFFGTLTQIKPRKYRLGGGQEEPDGSTSFLFRFIGSAKGVAGELYLRKENNSWLLEEIILEKIRDIEKDEEPYTYDFSPYERFF
jgi:hypothetical protein